MKPDLEVVQIGRAESFKAWEHGYPFRTVRWHFHPECELHHVVATSGRYFVGDFIGTFEPGNLVLTGPNLPHNWVSDIAPAAQIPLRSRVVQFSEGFIAEAMALMPELGCFGETLERSRSGVLFGAATSARVGPMLEELVGARGVRRLEIFMGVTDALARALDTDVLTSAAYLPDPSGFMSAGLNKALAYIGENLTEPFDERDLAAIAGLSAGAFSRSFRRRTGLALVEYVNRLRINLACQLLMGEAEMKITEVCFSSGFNNISNFNRQFLSRKGMSPSRFRALLLENEASAAAAPREDEGRERARAWPRPRETRACLEAGRRMNAIAAAVIGGTSLFGGRGSAWSALLGIIVIQSIANGLTLLNLSSSLRYMITGGVLAIAVIVDSLARQSRVSHGRA